MRAKTHFFKNLNMATILDPADPADKDYSQTKVCATIGPSCQSVDKLVELLQAGMSAARWVAHCCAFAARILAGFNSSSGGSRRACQQPGWVVGLCCWAALLHCSSSSSSRGGSRVQEQGQQQDHW
jgi:hypothetical protein